MHPELVVRREDRLARPLDLQATLLPARRGRADRCTVIISPDEAWRATRTPEGPATLRLQVDPRRSLLRAAAWGPGATWIIDQARRIAGADDDPAPLAAMLRRDRRRAAALLRELLRRFPGLRLPSTGAAADALVASIVEQKVTGIQARRSYGWLVRHYSDVAPGPGQLRLPPDPARLARTPAWALHPAGLEERRAATLARACRQAARLDRLAVFDPEHLSGALRSIPGVGPWTVAEVGKVAVGDADAVSVGDYHLHNHVGWALAGLPRASDETMLELLAPYAGQRGRVTRLIEVAGFGAPRYGPRLSPQRIEAL